MDNNRKAAKHWLLDKAIESDYNTVIKEAMLTPEQREALEGAINRDLQVKTSRLMHIDTSTVKRRVQKAYDKIYLVLKKKLLI